jgi:hypothetical protein
MAVIAVTSPNSFPQYAPAIAFISILEAASKNR